MRFRYTALIQVLIVIFVFLIFVPQIHADEPTTGVYGFESGRGQKPGQWLGAPSPLAASDSVVFHSGQISARIERKGECKGTFSALRFDIPSDREGEFIELRGWLKSENVEGWFGLWFRQDSKDGIVGFDNMMQHKLKGTTEWTEYSIKLPLSPEAHNLAIGALTSGEGTIWIDDFSLYIDDRPFAEAPLKNSKKPTLETTILDTDIEFVDGSGIEISHLSDIQASNLTLLGRVWGFLKYHHPAVTNGKYHWDFELFRIMPRILTCVDEDAARQALISWINALGAIDQCRPCAQSPLKPALVANTEWLSDITLLGNELAALLKEVHAARPASGGQFWVGLFPNVGNPDFSRELSYYPMYKLDAGYRLLALYRFWNIVEYWCPNRGIIGEDWVGVLREFVPQIALGSDDEIYRLNMTKLVARLNDTHTQLSGAYGLRPPSKVGTVPVALRWIENQAVISGWTLEPDGPDTKLQIGDVILAVNGKKTEKLMAEWAPFYSASNEHQRNSQLATALVQGPVASCKLQVLREEKEVELTVSRIHIHSLDKNRHKYHTLQGNAYQMLPSGIAYMALDRLKKDNVTNNITDAINHDAKGLIIDCRAYPSDFAIYRLGGHLVAEKTMFVTFTLADKKNPGAFLWMDFMPFAPVEPHFARPVVILVDEVTQSSAEYHALAFRAAPQAIVMGSTTSGADGNVSRFTLPGGLSSQISGIGIFDANHGPTQRVGIVPDIFIEPTVAGIRAGKDEVLEEAIETILRKQ